MSALHRPRHQGETLFNRIFIFPTMQSCVCPSEGGASLTGMFSDSSAEEGNVGSD